MRKPARAVHSRATVFLEHARALVRDATVSDFDEPHSLRKCRLRTAGKKEAITSYSHRPQQARAITVRELKRLGPSEAPTCHFVAR